MTPLLAFLVLLVTAFPASAQNTGHRLKFVFPFGDDAKQRVCPIDYRTLDGCCEPPDSMYTHAQRIGCCRPPNLTQTVGANTRCCTPWQPADQSRWGQTESSPCGGYCAAPNVKYSYSGYTSCCSDCDTADGVLAFQSTTNVCGTCCSRVPESCGNAGERVCAPGTGSAYCSSDITKCMPPTDWITGTSGEGGYSCCLSCSGTRYDYTSSDCGVCCDPVWQSYSAGTNMCYQVACKPGDTGTFSIHLRNNCETTGQPASLTLSKGMYHITVENGCWNFENSVNYPNTWQNKLIYVKQHPTTSMYVVTTLTLPDGNVGNGNLTGLNESECKEKTLEISDSTTVQVTTQTETFSFYILDRWSNQRYCGDNSGDMTYRWTCVE